LKNAALLMVTALAACGGRQHGAGEVTADDAVFVVKSNVPEAAIFVDGRFIGPVGVLKGGVAVVPGHHRVELRHDDYFSRYVELDMKRAERKKLELDLAPVLP
jgi:hypothetical protein